MSDRKGWGSTVLGWFVVQEGQAEGQADGAGDAPDSAAVAPASPEPPAFVTEPPAAPGGRVDFPKVYEAAGVGAEEQGRVAKAAELLGALPAGTEAAVKKQIVEASLKAFGVPLDKIIEGAVQEIQALEAYIRAGAADTTKVHEESEKRIAEFEEEIKRIKTVMESRTAEQLAVVQACNEKKLGIQKVLEFFGQEKVARVVRDSPKLVEPKAS
jgi:hypothetical protein